VQTQQRSHVYFTDVITEIVNGHPNIRIDELLPWPIQQRPLKVA
jgi:hypothetical protein